MLFDTQTSGIRLSVTMIPILHCVPIFLCNKALLWETLHSTVKSTHYCCTLEEEIQPKSKLFKRYTGCSCSKRQTSYQKRPKQMHCHIKFYILVSCHHDILHSLCQVIVCRHKPSPPYSKMSQTLTSATRCHRQEYEFQFPQATAETLVPLTFSRLTTYINDVPHS
jgi:hypothetical protein